MRNFHGKKIVCAWTQTTYTTTTPPPQKKKRKKRKGGGGAELMWMSFTVHTDYSLILVRRRTRYQNREFESRQERRESFSFFFLQSYLSLLSLISQWYLKDPGHSARSAGDMLRVTDKLLYTLVPTKLEWADYALLE